MAVEPYGEEVRDDLDRRESADRSFITRWVVGAYLAFLVAMVAFIVVRGGATGNWSDAVHDVTEVFKIGVLPIVTLVIGHYFGRGERR